MTNKPKSISSSEIEQGSTGIVTHRVSHENQPQYEQWLQEIAPVCKSYPGHLDLQVIRPIPGLTHTYTIVIRFDTHEHLHAWINSADRKGLIDKVRPFLCKDDEVTIKSGLDFWFTPEGAKAKLPTRWKQCLLTWSAIFPVSLLVQSLCIPLLQHLGVPNNHYLLTFIISGIVVVLMVYVVMPRYTKLVQHWLFN